MTQIIPRDLIKHLEWAPGKEQPKPQQTTQSQPSQQTQGNLQVKTDFSKYIQVGMSGLNGSPVVISPFELENFNNMNYDNTHVKLFENGLYMPTPGIFMPHFKNVVEAFHETKKLFYADGSEVPREEISDMYNHLTKDFKDIYGQGQPGVWTWLNAKFVKGKGARDLELEAVIGKSETSKKPRLETTKEELENCLFEDVFIDFAFNSQGLASSESKYHEQEYKQGENIRFWYPREGAVAGFIASSGRAGLSCVRYPSNSGHALGVFGCAEVAQKSGGTK